MQRTSNRLVQGLLYGLIIATVIPAAGCIDGGDPAEPSAEAAEVAQLPAAPGGPGMYVVVNRPKSVPANFVATPNGWFDPACVITVGEGEAVTAAGHVARLDGSIARPASTCSSPRFDIQGRMVAERGARAELSPPTSNGWISDTQTVTAEPLSFVHTQWTVPLAPRSNTGQIIYFFPGLEDATSGQTILQPVLGWNQSEGPRGWSLASWHCCADGQTWHSAYIPAVAGSTVSGDMTGTECSATGQCPSWSIVSTNAAGQKVTLNTTTTETMNWLFGAVLEAYSIDTCNELPFSTTTVSSDFKFASAVTGTAVAMPAWTKDTPAQTPSCGYAIATTATTTTLSWLNR